MTNTKQQAQDSLNKMFKLNKIVDNLLVYTDEVVEQLKPLVRENITNINKWDTFGIIDMAFMTNENERVFGSFTKDFIYMLFDKGALSPKLKEDIDRSIYMQLWQDSLK